MSIDQLAAILLRRRRSFLVAFVLCVVAVVAATLSLDKTYEATATLFVGEPTSQQEFVDTRLVEQHTRTYATLAANPNSAAAVAEQLPFGLERDELLQRMTFTPVERTQLLQITAEGGTPDEAQAIANAYAETFAERMSELFADGQAPAAISLNEPAVLPTAPSKPNPPLYIGFGILLSLFLALAFALLRERLDTRLRVAASDDEVLEQPIVARIPRFEGRDGRADRGVFDRFAILKTNLDFFDEHPARVVVVTSPGVSEGKSTVSANLALAAAADGERVALIEADLRRPGLASTVIADTVSRNPLGLSNYLVGAAQEEQILTAHPEYPRLAVIWSGMIPPNPTALLGSHRLDTLIDSLRLDFDRVIIDTCPISVGADASLIASRVDGALYIIDERSTKRAEAVAGLNQLRSVRARLLGVVLNRSSVVGRDGYYYQQDEPAALEPRPRAAAKASEGPESLS
jgi:succinoglycan biosynthesis transport protein ExoP